MSKKGVRRLGALRVARDTEVQSGERARRAEIKLTSNKTCNALLCVLAWHGMAWALGAARSPG